MPRVGSLRQLNRDGLTPFARLIYDYLLSFQPTMLVSELAAASGISNNTIWSWLKHDIIPHRQTVVKLAERVPDLATLDELLAAAGLPSTAATQRERAAHADMLRASLGEILALVDADPLFDAAARAIVHQAMERKVEEFLAQTDTWREYAHASPALHEAQRVAEHARIHATTPPTATRDHSDQDAERDHGRDNHPSGPYRRTTGV